MRRRFSLFELELKKGADVSYPEIKRARRTQAERDSNRGRATITSSKIIKPINKTNIKK